MVFLGAVRWVVRVIRVGRDEVWTVKRRCFAEGAECAGRG